MLKFLNNNKESNFNNTNSPKSPLLSSYNLYSLCNICSTINIIKRLPIQVPLVNKWYTPKANIWENIKESR